MELPVIDMKATGANIARIRKLRGLSVKDLQGYLGFDGPQAIYKWQWGQCLPSIDNLFALSRIFNISIEEILVEKETTKISFFCYKNNRYLDKKYYLK
ncbi:helix-turn-helix transcriptional regulator [Clostridioides difficile]